MEPIFSWIIEYGYWAIFVLLMVGIVGIPIPDETLLLLSGYLVSQGKLQFQLTIATAFFGSACGISLSYFFGWWMGPSIVLRCERLFHLQPGALDRAKSWYQKKGKYALFFGYYIPGVRHLTALLAGSAKLPFPTIGLFAYSGGFVWALTFIGHWVRTRRRMEDRFRDHAPGPSCGSPTHHDRDWPLDISQKKTATIIIPGSGHSLHNRLRCTSSLFFNVNISNASL